MSITSTTINPARTQAALQSIETAFSTSVLHPAVLQALQELGVEVQDVADINVVTRCAAMGRVAPEVVWATFFNPNPAAIWRLIPSTWDKASPEAVLEAQRAALDDPFKTAAAGMDPGDLSELAALCRVVTETAIRHGEGRPLFAALAGLPVPDEDHLVIWHAARLLREHRGDGHIAALVVEGLGRVDALVIHAAMLPAYAEGLRRSRRWTIDDWTASMESLRRRGWLTEDPSPTFTADGRARRRWIEDRTDILAAVAFEPLGDDGVERLIELGTTYTQALETAGIGITLRVGIPMGD